MKISRSLKYCRKHPCKYRATRALYILFQTRHQQNSLPKGQMFATLLKAFEYSCYLYGQKIIIFSHQMCSEDTGELNYLEGPVISLQVVVHGSAVLQRWTVLCTEGVSHGRQPACPQGTHTPAGRSHIHTWKVMRNETGVVECQTRGPKARAPGQCYPIEVQCRARYFI